MAAVTSVSGTPVWSADGLSVAVATGGGGVVAVVNMTTGAAQQVAAQGTAVNIAFAPTGSSLAIATASGMTVYADVAGTAHVVTGMPENGAIAWTIAG